MDPYTILSIRLFSILAVYFLLVVVGEYLTPWGLVALSVTVGAYIVLAWLRAPIEFKRRTKQ